MNRYIRNSGIVISSILAVTTVNAETWGPKNFSFQGAANAVTYVGWNPLRTPPPSSNQLLEFKFYGSPDPFAGCALEADGIFRDGPVTPVYFTNVTVNTGLPSTNASMTWSPISDPLRCTFSNWQGYAHAHLKIITMAVVLEFIHIPAPDPTIHLRFSFKQHSRLQVTKRLAVSSSVSEINPGHLFLRNLSPETPLILIIYELLLAQFKG